MEPYYQAKDGEFTLYNGDTRKLVNYIDKKSI